MKMTRVFLATLILVGILDLPHFAVFSADVHSASMRVTENLRGQVVLLPQSAPETDRLTLVSFITIVPDAEVLAAIATLGGAALGGIIGSSTGNAGAGAGIGGLIGLGAGFLTGDQLQKKQNLNVRAKSWSD